MSNVGLHRFMRYGRVGQPSGRPSFAEYSQSARQRQETRTRPLAPASCLLLPILFDGEHRIDAVRVRLQQFRELLPFDMPVAPGEVGAVAVTGFVGAATLSGQKLWPARPAVRLGRLRKPGVPRRLELAGHAVTYTEPVAEMVSAPVPTA